MQTKLMGIIQWAMLGTILLPQLASRTNAAVNLEEALDTAGLVWSTVGSPAWEGQTLISHDGVDSAQTGAVADGAAVSLQTTVQGPGTITFWWKVSSESNNGFLKFFIGGVQYTRISGEVDWQSQSLSVAAGSQTLKWTYSKNASGSAGLDRGWVDQVQFVPDTACSYTLSPGSSTHGSTSATGSVSLTTAAGCVWNVVNTNPWVAITSAKIGSGMGTVTYAVASNATGPARSGVLTIAGQSYSIHQSGAPDPDPGVTAPANQSVDVGATATFSVTASGTGPFTYQWQFNSVALANGAGISGANAATLSLANVQPSQVGAYRLVVTGSAGTVTSAAATLSIGLPPSVALAVQPNGDLKLTFTGTLQHASEIQGTFDDVPGNPEGTHLIPKGSLLTRQYFKARRKSL